MFSISGADCGRKRAAGGHVIRTLYYNTGVGYIVTIRIDEETARQIRRLEKETGMTRSAIVRDALRRLAPEESARPASSAYALAADLIGSYRSGRGDLSVSTGRRLKSALRTRKR